MGLQKADLRDMVDHIFEIDSFKSKMGEDNNIVTISFSTKTNETAKDLVEFLEKGYSFILDADATPGEQKDGTYKFLLKWKEMILYQNKLWKSLMELANYQGMINLNSDITKTLDPWKQH